MGKYEDLLSLAKNDLKVASLLLNSANDELMQNSAAYHAQQAVEKLMKALIVKAGAASSISHSIIELSKDLDELKIQYPEWVNDKDDDITSWATTIRYNANFKADHDEIEEVIKQTEEWIENV